MKNIAVFIDGTDNFGRPGKGDNTNVFKLFEMTQPATPCCRYIRGIGTGRKGRPPSPMFVLSWFSDRIDHALGRGATRQLKQAYLYVGKHYQTGDQLFLFGFSRGAFIARMLAGFLGKVGALFRHKSTEKYLEEAFCLYYFNVDGRRFATFLRRMHARLPTPYDFVIKTHFLGQWDAVEALTLGGLSADEEEKLIHIAKRDHLKPLPDWIGSACHALAAHEFRENFRPLIWSGTSRRGQSLKQLWFAGTHADVGGGCEAFLAPGTVFSDVALAWIADEARLHGLCCEQFDAPEVHRMQTAPHKPPGMFSVIPELRVRAELIHQIGTVSGATHLHASLVARSRWDPDHAYANANSQYQPLWDATDTAAMCLHLASIFPGFTPVLPLSPRMFDKQVANLHAALKGHASMRDDVMAHTVALLMAFDRESATLLAPMIQPAIVPQFIRILDSILAGLPQPVSVATAQSHWCYHYTEYLQLLMTLIGKNGWQTRRPATAVRL